jgi:hypothetical protein
LFAGNLTADTGSINIKYLESPFTFSYKPSCHVNQDLGVPAPHLALQLPQQGQWPPSNKADLPQQQHTHQQTEQHLPQLKLKLQQLLRVKAQVYSGKWPAPLRKFPTQG